MIDCIVWNGELGSLGSGHSDHGGRLLISTPIIRSISSTSFCLILFVTLMHFFHCNHARIPRAFAVFPLDDSMIVSLVPAHCIRLSAVLSFIEPNGFIYSSFAYISTHLIPWIRSSILRSGVFQM